MVAKPEGHRDQQERGPPGAGTMQVLLVAIAIVAGFRASPGQALLGFSMNGSSEAGNWA